MGQGAAIHSMALRAMIVTLRNAVSASTSECPWLAGGSLPKRCKDSGERRGVSPLVYVLCEPFTFRQLFSPKVIWRTPCANVPACGKPAGLRQPLAARRRRGLEVSALVAANVKLPRASRGHHLYEPELPALRNVMIETSRPDAARSVLPHSPSSWYTPPPWYRPSWSPGVLAHNGMSGNVFSGTGRSSCFPAGRFAKSCG